MSAAFRLAAVLRVRELQEELARAAALPARRTATAAAQTSTDAAQDLQRRGTAPATTGLAAGRALLLAGALAVRGHERAADEAAEQADRLDASWQAGRQRVAGLELLRDRHDAARERDRLARDQQATDETTSARWARRTVR